MAELVDARDSKSDIKRQLGGGSFLSVPSKKLTVKV